MVKVSAGVDLCSSSSTMSRKPCFYHNRPGGCRRGDECSFSHSDPIDAASSPDALSTKSGSQSSSSSGAPPPGACSFYWKSGNCKHEFRCRFRHIEPPSSTNSTPASERNNHQLSAVDAIAPFLTDAGLAKVNGPGTDCYFSLSTTQCSPNEAHNYLKSFLYDDFRFRTTFNIYSFLKILNSACKTNPSWTQADGQLLLVSVASGNGILRIGDVIRWPQVSTQAGPNRVTLSFQRGFLPLLRYLSSEFVVGSTLSHLVNALYTQIMINFDHFAEVIEDCMDKIVKAGSFKDPSSASDREPLGSQVIVSLACIFFECVTRFKNAISIYPRLGPIIRKLGDWMEVWITGISASPPTFDDVFNTTSQAAQEHIITHLRNRVHRLLSIVDREQNKDNGSRRRTKPTLASASANEGIVSALQISYEGPGEEREEGPRHDNDYIDIAEIRVAPTHEELLSRIPPFLPGNFFEAPHIFRADSMERLLDIQFRLLREELTAPLRTSVQLVRDDFQAHAGSKTRLSDLIEKRGGKYRGFADGQESVIFNVYTAVEFSSLVPDRRGISVAVTFDAPPGRARSSQPKARTSYWEGMSGKRLLQGGLIALIWKSGNDVTVYLGSVASSLRDLVESARHNNERVGARIAFFDAAVELRILMSLKHQTGKGDKKVLVEAPVMFEAIRPFLEALRVEPESIPFRQYLVHRPSGYLSSMQIKPPNYAAAPNFTYQLSSLFPPEAAIQDLRMSIADPLSIEFARQELRRMSRLDPSQADAVVSALTRELTLIQGPPGTGKSYTGVELLRVLLANKVGPVLLIAFTNHALDHMLCSVLDAKITSKIVRLGSRSADERISQFSIETLEMTAGQSRLDRTFRHQHHILKDVEEQLKKVMNGFLKTSVDTTEIMHHLRIRYPEEFDHLTSPPQWISLIKDISYNDDGDGPWQRVGEGGRANVMEDFNYAYWKNGQDLEFLRQCSQPLPPSPPTVPQVTASNKFAALAAEDPEPNDDKVIEDLDGDNVDLDDAASAPEVQWENEWVGSSDAPLNEEERPATRVPSPPSTVVEFDAPISASDLKHPREFFDAFGFSSIPQVHVSDRPLHDLLDVGAIWTMSLKERARLAEFWQDEARSFSNQSQMEDFERLRERHAEALSQYNEGKDETRRQVLHNVDIIGCTTTGAAKLTSLLKGVAPRIMLVEEAGQVLEAHVLGSLVASIEHLILIGDPLQLRPNLNNFALSMDSRRGAELFKFDMSLMERLAKAGLVMERIDVQRRMRPAISSLIRNTLYSGLEDHDLVKAYPPVRGFAKDVFFFSHNHRENGGGEESSSKFNTFEVEMIRDLVMYLLRQGCYSQEGDIVVLCAYLGQLAHVRDALSNEVAVVIDDRDQMALADQEADQEDSEDISSGVEHIKVAKRVRLRTVDNYQGEEAKIVILSLVRNAGSLDDDGDILGHSHGTRATIGFLKSKNRTNVALSRAREGLFILGNAPNLASRSGMWRSVIDELEEKAAIGDAFPVVCHRHPQAIEHVKVPGTLPHIAPDGGCLRPCDSRLKCGHVCPHKCHPDDPNHVAVRCFQPCRKLCSRGLHPCSKQCADDCGECQCTFSNIELPCGHRKASVPCYRMDSLDEVICDVLVSKNLPNCEHETQLACSVDTEEYRCQARCGGILTCCGRDCNSLCHQCQSQNIAEDEDTLPVKRANHLKHPCEKSLYCEHRCKNPCSQDHQCTMVCYEPCRQQCTHTRCKNYCSTPCTPCQEPCAWKCSHHSCPVSCGSVCARLPCDKRCEDVLPCGHRCPSVCGENCATQTCPLCAPAYTKAVVVDLVMHRTLEEVDVDQETLDELLITIPSCMHVFTVETLDGHCGMAEYYDREGSDGKWLRLRTPPHEFQRPPTCPTCRMAITCPRYGRIFKRADLDTLERNVASSMSRSIGKAHKYIESFSKAQAESELIGAATSVKLSTATTTQKVRKQRERARNIVLKAKRDVPAPPEALDPGNEKFHGSLSSSAPVWRTVTQNLIRSYTQASAVAATRHAHMNAWEAAFSFLYEREMDLATACPAQAPRNPHEHATRCARMAIGQPPPRADKTHLVEAFWVTLHIRFVLASLAKTWLEAIQNKGSSDQCRIWATYIRFLLRTCSQDAQYAFDIASRSESRRQMTRSSLLIMRANLEEFCFNVEMSRQRGTIKASLDTLVQSAAEKAHQAKSFAQHTIKSHRATRWPNASKEEEWLENTFSSGARIIVDEWTAILRKLQSGTFYEQVSLDEKMAIIGALSENPDFAHTGHFYRCPNGHPFVIGDCGGAMERSVCPECGAVIGGTNHTLESTNTRDSELEDIARQGGARPSPWAWGWGV